MKMIRVLFSTLFFLSTVMVTTTTMAVLDSDTVEAQTRRPKSKRKRSKRRRRRTRRPTSFAGIRTGLILTGPGNLTVDGSDNEVKFEDESGVGINGLAIFPIQNNIRGGVSLWFFPGYETNSANDRNSQEGSMMLLNAIGEFVLPVNQVDGFAYGEAGVALVLPGDDDTSDFLGFNIGVGLGAQFLVSNNMAIRADGQFGFYTVSNNDDNELSLSAQRIMLNIGVMFGLQ